MSRQRKGIYIILFGVLGLLIICLFTNLLLSFVYAKKQYETVSNITNWLIEEYPDDEQKIMRYMKEYDTEKENTGQDFLSIYGFDKSDFWKPYRNTVFVSTVFCVLILFVLFVLFLYLLQSKKRHRIREMTDYLTKANLGKDVTILPGIEDDFSGLEDEIYKNVTEMRLAKENAIKERQNFAESLANIAHQIKTPITSISVTVQLLENKLEEVETVKLKRQISRISQLIDTLLTVSKIDAGILELKKNNVDVYTLLELSIEALESQIRSKEIKIVLPNYPEVFFIGDLDWSVEVFINLIKNSIEHMPDKGTICFDYKKNPLYVEILVMDNGKGFDEKEIPYIFNRFYQGSQKSMSGTGIGLSMAKSIIEMQNGFITAKNLNSKGACFIIRFYCH